MFPVRYFCNEAFAPRYFPKIGQDAAATTDIPSTRLAMTGAGR